CDVVGLRGILLDHVVPGRYVEGRILQSQTLDALGGPLDVANDIAPVLQTTDIHTSNGTIHVINSVLLLDD
ncbi:MAG: hypothetical protein EA388_03295, partial [Nitriliruptor sp.]